MSDALAVFPNQDRSGSTGAEPAAPPTRRLRPAMAFGLGAAALAGLLVPAGDPLRGPDPSLPSAIADIGTTCCAGNVEVSLAPTDL
jgi:hypothetical protein